MSFIWAGERHHKEGKSVTNSGLAALLPGINIPVHYQSQVWHNTLAVIAV